jgi:Mg2+ and Co2+ transporter CorA
MENTIQLSEKNILKFKVKKENGEDTGLVIKIDLQDIELPLRMNKMQEIHKKNISLLKQKAIVIEKQEDKKGEGLLSWKQEEQIKLLREFYDNEMKALDMFIGQGMTKKILKAMDRYPYYDMFDDIVNSFEPVLNIIEKEANNMVEDIKKKYGNVNNGNTI